MKFQKDLPDDFEIQGCPANRGSECGHGGCGSRFKELDTEKLTHLFLAGHLNSERLCGPLHDRVINALLSFENVKVI